jgi:hypothetical protein
MKWKIEGFCYQTSFRPSSQIEAHFFVFTQRYVEWSFNTILCVLQITFLKMRPGFDLKVPELFNAYRCALLQLLSLKWKPFLAIFLLDSSITQFPICALEFEKLYYNWETLIIRCIPMQKQSKIKSNSLCYVVFTSRIHKI